MRRRHSARQAVLFLAALVQASTAAAQIIETIEPPSWWVDRDEQEVQLLIEGSGLDMAEVRVWRGPIKVSRVEPGLRGRALFVDVTVPAKADAGGCEFEMLSPIWKLCSLVGVTDSSAGRSTVNSYGILRTASPRRSTMNP